MPELTPSARWRRALPAGLLVFLAFFLIIGAWSLAAPYDGTPDERHHIYRAAGVTAGEVIGTPEDRQGVGSGSLQTVPGGLIREDTICWHFKDLISAACSAEPSANPERVQILSLAGRYNPVYYALVGWPLNIWPGWGGVLAARLLSAAGAAALLALGFSQLTRRPRALFIGALAVVVTPQTVHMASAVNPNGWEIAAGVAFFAAGIRLFYDPPEERTRTAIWIFSISAVLIAILRSGGPLLLGFGLLALLIPLTRNRIRDWWADARLRGSAIAIAVALAAGVIWFLAVKPQQVSSKPPTQTWSVPQATNYLVKLWEGYLDELVGVLSWLDSRIEGPFYSVWQGAAFTFIFLAVAAASRTGRWRLAALFAGGAIVPSLLQIAGANSAGFILMGRYLLPILAGLIIVSAYILEERGLPREWGIPLSRLFTVILVPMHVPFLAYTMFRWQNGIGGRIAVSTILGGEWEPVSGSLLPLMMVTAGVILLAWLYWRTAASGPPRARLKPHGAGE